MAQEFIMQVEPLNEGMQPEIIKILEKRVERESRKMVPALWEKTDKLNALNSSPEKSGSKWQGILGIVNWGMGLFLMLPGLMEPDKLFTPLLVGVAGWLIGTWFLWSLRRSLLIRLNTIAGVLLVAASLLARKQLGVFFLPGLAALVIALLAWKAPRRSRFGKEAKDLIERRKNPTQLKMVFGEGAMTFPDGRKITYPEFKVVFETKQLLAVLWEERILLLPKAGMAGEELDQLLAFLRERVEVVEV